MKNKKFLISDIIIIFLIGALFTGAGIFFNLHSDFDELFGTALVSAIMILLLSAPYLIIKCLIAYLLIIGIIMLLHGIGLTAISVRNNSVRLNAALRIISYLSMGIATLSCIIFILYIIFFIQSGPNAILITFFISSIILGIALNLVNYKAIKELREHNEAQ